MIKSLLSRFIGDKKFYRMVMTVALPIIIQNGITSLVSMLDNVMVGQLGTEQMSGVAIANRLFWVLFICLFGVVSGASIFGVQYYGSGDHEGVRYTFRYKIIACVIMGVIGILVFLFAGEPLISLFLHEGSDSGDIELAFKYGIDYIRIIVIGILPFSILQAYAGTLRDTGETILPMKAGVTAVIVNLALNYILIFGKFGAPALGVSGAAIATVVSRYVECGIVVIWTHVHKEKNKFICGAYKSLRIPGKLFKDITIKGLPLFANETLWAGGQALITQCYSIRGLAVVAAVNISSTIADLFNVVFIAIGSAVAIIIGQLLGAGKMEEAKDTDRKLLFLSVVSSIAIGTVLAVLSAWFPKIYNTTEEVRGLAMFFILAAAVYMPLASFSHASYFTIRAGGKTLITFLFDSVFVWVVSVPVAFVLSRYTGINIIAVYFMCQSLEIIKCIIGFILIKKGIWLNNVIKK